MARLCGYGGNVYVAQQIVENCEDIWDEQTGTGVTAYADTTDYKVGSASAKFVLTAEAGVAITASEVVSSMNLSTYEQLFLRAKCSVALDAADFKIYLDNTALCANPDATLSLPVLTAGTWKFCKITPSAGTFSACTAVISVGLYQAVDKGALSIWLDHLEAAKYIAGIKSWTLDYTKNVLETTAFDSSGHKTFIPGVDEWSGSFEGYKDTAPLTAGSVVGLELQESSTATQQWRGSCIITAVHVNTSHDGLVTYAYDFQGTDLLEIATA